MKLKYNFVTREIDGRTVAVAVGKDNAAFNGMIRLNGTGAFIFGMLARDTTAEAIADGLTAEFDVSAEDAAAAVEGFVEKLRERGLIEE